MTAPAVTALPAPARLPPALVGVLATLTAMTAGYCLLIWPEWRQNPDLSHGFFAPLVFALLLWEGRRQGPWRWMKPGPLGAGLQVVCLLGGLLAIGLAGLFAATLAWTHALVLFLLASALIAFLTAGWLLLADDRVRLLPLNGAVATAILLWLLVAPIPEGTYARLTLGLQRWVTGSVMDVLQLIGVPARQHGNIIELARTTVGVEEACSGVRSLISCTYAGFFFAAWQLRRPLRRVVLIVAAPLLALAMNFARSLTLTLLANAGTDIGGTWHDATGFAILGITAAILAGLAMLLETRDAPPTAPTASAASPQPVRATLPFWLGATVAVALAAFFMLNTRRGSASADPAAPDLAHLLPAQAEGWKVVTPDDLYRFSDILHTTSLLERTYLRQDDQGGFTQLTVYVAYWPAGQSSVSQVASHTPDACWPGAGWTSTTSGAARRQSLGVEGLHLAPAEYRLFQTERGLAQHVWFWHVFDGRVIDYRDPYSLSALLQIALQYGFKRQGSQYFIRLSSNRPWPEIATEPVVREIVANLDRIGV